MKKLIFHVQLEFLKLRRLHTWLIALAGTPLIAYFAASGQGHPSQGYIYTLYGMPLYNAIIMPLLCAAITSRICENEYDSNALKSILTLQKPQELFHAKFITALIFVTLLCCVEPLTLVFCGHIFQYQDAISAFDIAYFAFSQYLVCIFFIVAIQIISLYFENQLISISVGVIMSLLGLFSVFFPPEFMRLIPSSYFSLLNFVGMSWDRATQVTSFYHAGYPWNYVIMLTIATIAMYVISLHWFTNKEN